MDLKNGDRRILAIASGGGHWVQLQRMRPAWDGCDVAYVTTKEGYRDEVMRDAVERGQPRPRFYTVVDANRWSKIRLIRQMLEVVSILVRFRPHVVVTTGAAPGFFALWIARKMGARAIWVDSIANAEELSLSGAQAGKHATLWLTQWPHLASEGGPSHEGSVI